MQADAVSERGLRASATARTTMSRIRDHPDQASPLPLLRTTGSAPQSHPTIDFATSCSGVSGVQTAGLRVMISFTFMLYLPTWHRVTAYRMPAVTREGVERDGGYPRNP